MKRKLLAHPAPLFILVGGLLGAGGPAPAHAQSSADPSGTPVKTTMPRQGEIWRMVSLPARVAANQQVTLYAKVGGYLKQIQVDKGDEVKSGQLLAEIEVPELLADRSRSKAELEIAELDYKRAAEAQKKAPDLIVAQSVDAARAKQAVAKASLERAETLLGFTKITAPFGGIVTMRFVDPGAFIPAATSGTAAQNSALLSLSDFKTVRVQVAVPEPEVPLIRKDLPVRVTIDELPGRRFDGTITRFSYALDDATRTMLAEVDLKNPQGELRPGMYATARISVEKHSDALLVPVEAIVAEKSGTSAFKLVDGKAMKTPVKTGFNDGVSIEIQEGLSSSDSVILVGKMNLSNGQKVSPAPSK